MTAPIAALLHDLAIARSGIRCLSQCSGRCSCGAIKALNAIDRVKEALTGAESPAPAPDIDAAGAVQPETQLPWRWWTSNSFRRLSSDATGRDGDVLSGTIQWSDGHPDIASKEQDRAYIVTACNERPALLAELRRLRSRPAPASVPACNCMPMCPTPCNGACGCAACRAAWAGGERLREAVRALVEKWIECSSDHARHPFSAATRACAIELRAALSPTDGKDTK